jgi:hypothetical protein
MIAEREGEEMMSRTIPTRVEIFPETSGIWTSTSPGMCPWCAGFHVGVCPRVKLIEYYPDGGIKKVEFFPAQPSLEHLRGVDSAE